MPKAREKERVVGRHFVWLLGRRNEVYVADGRSNPQPAGRHSLGTKNYDEALQAIQRLDQVKAVELGLADSSLLDLGTESFLTLDDGRKLYEGHVSRPAVVGGASKHTSKRYRAVFDKFIPFAKAEGVFNWNGVTRSLLDRYAAHLDGEGYAYATEYLELTTIKQAVKFFVEENHLPPDSLIRLPVAKPQGTDTYCWRPDEVAAIVAHCRKNRSLHWLADVLTGLACTGLRISELADLRWSDIDLEKNLISLTDETTRAPGRRRRPARQTKSRRSRSFPIGGELRPILESLARSTDGLVFHGPQGGRIKADRVRTILIRDVLKKLETKFPTQAGEIGFADGRLHSFRHYFCSTCANSGTSEQVVKSWLGHSDSKMVRHYYHLYDDEAQRQMERLVFIGPSGSMDASG